MKQKTWSLGLAQAAILIVGALLIFYAGVVYANSQPEKVVYESVVPKLNNARIEQFAIVGNTWVNEAIDKLESEGWNIVSVKAFNEACEYGYYDVLITYK